MVVTPISLRQAALLPLLESHAVRKAQLALAIDTRLPVSAQEAIPNPGGIPGRPDRPILVAHTEMRHLSLATLEGRAALVHSIAHIELNAIDLALDVVWRFAGMPDAFYLDWVQIAKEEAKHFLLLQKHLQSLGFDYGDFPAHHALWQMAERTQSDLLARIGLVPRTLELAIFCYWILFSSSITVGTPPLPSHSCPCKISSMAIKSAGRKRFSMGIAAQQC